jgi:hypothetical protein
MGGRGSFLSGRSAIRATMRPRRTRRTGIEKVFVLLSSLALIHHHSP